MVGLRKFLEPEETVGELWHRFVDAQVATPRYPEAAVRLEERVSILGVLFRGLGGKPGIQIKAAADEISGHRLHWRRRLGRDHERTALTSLDGDTLLFPDVLDVFPERALNAELYTWLAAWAATASESTQVEALDPGQAEIAYLRHAHAVARRTVERYPGLAPTYDRLKAACLVLRPHRTLPESERLIESCIRALLSDQAPDQDAAGVYAAIVGEPSSRVDWSAPAKHRPHLPVPLWGKATRRPVASKRRGGNDDSPDTGGDAEEGDGRVRKGRREDAPDIDRKDGLILNRFEKILSWTEFMRVNRGVDDEDPDQARKAADDHEQISLVQSRRRAATRLKIDLDLSPEEVERDRLYGAWIYPEWNYRDNGYLPGHCRVLAGEVSPDGGLQPWAPDAAARRRIRAVRRQFEALRPRRTIAHRQVDGSELDIDALIRARCDLIARGEGSDAVYLQARQQERDLAVAVLIDTSRSTEAFLENRRVLDIAKEALTALTQGLAACGDEHAIFSFSSCKRHRVWVQTVKTFDEPCGDVVLSRIASLRPGHYTRLGAAIRHVSAQLSRRPRQHRLLLVITDGKPNDLDHYEGRYGIEDTARSIREARRLGHAVFGITIDAKARGYFPYIFGQNAFAIVSHAGKLTQALPVIYRHVIQ